MSVLSRTIAKYLRPSPHDDTIIETELTRIENTVAAFSRQADVRGRASGLSAGNIDIGFSYGIQLRNPSTGAVGVHLKPTGDAFLGKDTNDPGKTSLAVFSNSQTYNGETMGDGDFLLGDNTTGKANLLWDFSTGQLKFRGGTTIHAYVGTDGKIYAGAGAVVLSNTGIVANAGTIAGWTISATQIYKAGIILDSSLERITVGSATPRIVIDGVNKYIHSTNYASGVSGFVIAGASGNAEFNDIRARGEIATAVFTYNEIQATAGTLGVFKSAATVKTAFTTPASVSGTVAVEVNNSPAGGALLAASDVVRIKTWNGSAVIDSWFTVTTVGTNYGTYTGYTLTLQNGSTSASVTAGTAVADYGPSGSGFITLSADGAVGSSANMSIVTHAGSPWSAQTLRARFGNLNGSYGAVSSVYGVGIGDYSASNYLSYNADGAGAFVLKAGGGTVVLDASGISIAAGTGTESMVKWMSGANRIGHIYTSLTSGAMSIENNDTQLNLDKTTITELGTTSKATAGTARRTRIQLIAATAAGDGNYIDFQVEDIAQRMRIFANRTEVSQHLDFTAIPTAGALRFAATGTPTTGAVSGWPIQLTGLYSGGIGYTGGLVFGTSDNNPTKPKGGIYVKNTVTGSIMSFGVSSDYPSGITREIHLGVNGDFYTIPWTDYSSTSTVVGWSSFTTKKIFYKRVGDLVFVNYEIDGTSDAVTASFTLPYTQNGGLDTYTAPTPGVDNGAIAPGAFGGISNGGATAAFHKVLAGSGWTASGIKEILGEFWYRTTQAP